MSGFDAEIEALSKLSGEPLLSGMYELSQKCGAAGDPDERIEWLKRLLDVSSQEGSFAWDLKAFGELRQLYYSSERFAFLKPDLLWYFKWVVNRVGDYADVPLSTVEALFKEMTDFYASAEESPRPIYAARCRFLLDAGRTDEAKEWFDRWQAARTGGSDDCAACESSDRVYYHLCRAEIPAAFAAAEGILEGKEWCNHTPATLASLMMPAVQNEQTELALQMQRFSQTYVRTTPTGLRALAHHVALLSFVGDLSRARRLVLMGLARAKESDNDRDKFYVYRASGMWASLLTLSGQKYPVGFPRSVLQDPVTGRYRVPIEKAASYLLAVAGDYAIRLDGRNGNREYSARLDTTEKWIAELIERITAERSGGGTAGREGDEGK